MAKTPSSRSSKMKTPSSPPLMSAQPDEGGDFTGRYLVLMREDGMKEGLQAIQQSTGLKDVCNSADFGLAAVAMEEAEQSNVFVLDKLKVAVVQADPTQAMGLQAASTDDGAILAVEPERIMYAISDLPESSLEYLRGYRDAVNHLYDALAGKKPALPVTEEAAAEALAAIDNAQFTWGLQATRVAQSRFSGRGVRVAVLDTGFDLDHPDFAGRVIKSQSFINGQTVNDLNGHGTHCTGTALGPRIPPNNMRRYGCAFQGDIFIGKVLSNQGSGADNGILAGINWALANQCRIISMSLGATVQPGESFSPIYEAVAQRALRSSPGTLIIAAAGNDSRNPFTGRRYEPPRPVGRPANCPSIMAVAAVDSLMSIAPFSNGGINPNGGGIDLAGPGVNIFSSAPVPAVRDWPARYHTISGTSMATPHVAGIAAMWLEARGNLLSASTLWQLLTGNARRLNLQSRDVGAGLVQAPV